MHEPTPAAGGATQYALTTFALSPLFADEGAAFYPASSLLVLSHIVSVWNRGLTRGRVVKEPRHADNNNNKKIIIQKNKTKNVNKSILLNARPLPNKCHGLFMRGIAVERREAAACAANTVQRMQGHGEGKQTQGRHLRKCGSQGCL